MLGAKDDKKKEKKEDSEKSIRDNIRKSLKDILTLRYSSFSVVLSWCFSIKGIMIEVSCPFCIFCVEQRFWKRYCQMDLFCQIVFFGQKLFPK